ncbi:MAG: hypothetical protein IT562_09435, partial [Alphaproteobacteria bacterium]|nr:hypothetical protein [Alphaproteobacteria bacterium]
GIVIAFPSLVTAGLDKGPKEDPNKVKIQLQMPTQQQEDDSTPPPVQIK